jgi:hypothetical protein
MLSLTTNMFGMSKGRKLLKFRKFDEKRATTPKWAMGFTL